MPPANGCEPSSRRESPDLNEAGLPPSPEASVWSGFALAGRLLLPFNAHMHAESPSWARAGVWLPLWGVLIGLAMAAAFRGIWYWLGEYRGVRIAPMAALLAVDAGFLGYRLLDAATQIVARWRRQLPGVVDRIPTAPIVFIALALVIRYALFVSLPAGAVPYPADWRENLRFLYPFVLYRPLVLMVLWGRWGVLLAACIGRMATDASSRAARLAEGASLPVVMAWWLGAAGLTVLYCSPTPGHVAWAMLISLGMLLVGYLVSFALARRFGGQNETTILAVGWAVESAFLLAYLPVARAIYWY